MFYQANSTVNITNSTGLPPTVPSVYCTRFQDEEYFDENWHVTLASTIFNLLICPVTILMNVLVVLAVKTRPRLQSKCNILLACLAVTDLFVGATTLPTFIAVEIYALAGGSVTTYCNNLRMVSAVFMSPPPPPPPPPPS